MDILGERGVARVVGVAGGSRYALVADILAARAPAPPRSPPPPSPPMPTLGETARAARHALAKEPMAARRTAKAGDRAVLPPPVPATLSGRAAA